jgi:hypothetical protein
MAGGAGGLHGDGEFSDTDTVRRVAGNLGAKYAAARASTSARLAAAYLWWLSSWAVKTASISVAEYPSAARRAR